MTGVHHYIDQLHSDTHDNDRLPRLRNLLLGRFLLHPLLDSILHPSCQSRATPCPGGKRAAPFHAAELTQKVTAAKIYPDQDRIVYGFFLGLARVFLGKVFGFGTGNFG